MVSFIWQHTHTHTHTERERERDMHTYMYTYIHTHVQTCTYTQTHVHTNTCLHPPTNTYTCIYTHMPGVGNFTKGGGVFFSPQRLLADFFIAVSVNFELNFIHSTNCPPLHAHTHTYTHIHTYIHMYTHTCTPYMCVYMCLSVCMCVCACVYYVYVCIHVCVGVCSCHMNLTFMVNYTCRYFRDTTLNICKCPSKDLSIEDTGWQSNCSFFQEELAYYYYKMSALLCYVCQ